MPRGLNSFRLVFSRLVVLVALALPLGAWAAEPNIAPVDINSASAETLADALQGVGMSRAQAIVTFRNSHGPFEKPEDLVKVKGIGELTLAKNLGRIVLE